MPSRNNSSVTATIDFPVSILTNHVFNACRIAAEAFFGVGIQARLLTLRFQTHLILLRLQQLIKNSLPKGRSSKKKRIVLSILEIHSFSGFIVVTDHSTKAQAAVMKWKYGYCSLKRIVDCLQKEKRLEQFTISRITFFSESVSSLKVVQGWSETS